ncbi:hypothetical protein QAD02_012594 [Eretmocerus hayati]|uniref:Uncharacterized protein n=1 Tax=Eretmocerus hayati TaxID=131215 RepID=A0ACC2P0A3_9HYME|nr:hypothetical protein QAD02_012594 [Eretmocerus hayati]
MESVKSVECVSCHVNLKHKKRSDDVISGGDIRCRVCYRKFTRPDTLDRSCPSFPESANKKSKTEVLKNSERDDDENSVKEELPIDTLRDVFVFDRGFAKTLSELEEKGYRAHMPSFVNKDKKQLTTARANASRKVTKTRYIVEVVNGRIKQSFKYFDEVWSNKSLGHAWDDFHVACAIYNAFYPIYESDKGYADIIYQEMMRRDSDTNILRVITEDLGFARKRSIFETTSSESLPQFSRYTTTDLYFISLGTYQLKQAVSYYSEHLKTNGKYIFQICAEVERIDSDKYGISLENPLLIKIRIQSRHSGNKKYCLFILTEGENNENLESIQESTSNGNVMVDAQSSVSRHPSSIIESLFYWFLGHARYLRGVTTPAQFLDNFFYKFPELTEGDEELSDEDS